MAKKKLQRFAELATFPNVIQGWHLAGNWHRDYFKNDRPITLELACGRGEYTIGLAQRFPWRNFIGIDVKGARLWRGARMALDLNLTNVMFLRMPIGKITDIFCGNNIEEIWLPFPDPFPKRRKENRRLTSLEFLQKFKKILIKGAQIHLKTDDKNLFDYTISLLNSKNWKIHNIIEDLYKMPVNNELLMIQTTYELKHLAAGKTIKYLCFSLS